MTDGKVGGDARKMECLRFCRKSGGFVAKC